MKGLMIMKKNDVFILTDEQLSAAFEEAVKEDITTAVEQGQPVCGYDVELNKSYILYPDGRKVYA